MEQFKYLQEVIILQMLINGERVDMGGRFIGIKATGEKKGQAEVEVNTIRLFVPVERVVDSQQYWNNKRKG